MCGPRAIRPYIGLTTCMSDVDDDDDDDDDYDDDDDRLAA